MKKLLLLALLLCGISQAWSDTWTDSEGITWTYTDDGKNATITKASKTFGDIVIPSTVNGYDVTSIGERAFYGCSGLTSVTISEGVRSINQYAFSGCSGLSSVTIPSSVTSIDYEAFSGCSGLTSVTIPESVTYIGYGVFTGCSELSVTINNDAIMSKTYTSSSSLKIILGSVKSLIVGDGVTSIGNYAFYGCTGLTSVSIPESVMNIGKYAFYNCTDLTKVMIGEGVTSIGERAFYGCSNQLIVSIPSSVTSIGVHALYEMQIIDCNWEEPIPLSDSFGSNTSLLVPFGTKNKYAMQQYWCDAFEIIEKPLSCNLVANDVSIQEGIQNIDFVIGMDNVEDVAALEFSLVLPSGVTVSNTDEGKLQIEKMERSADLSLSSSEIQTGKYKILLYSNDISLIAGESGGILTFNLNVSDELEEGIYPIELTDICITLPSLKNLYPSDVVANLVLVNQEQQGGFLMGDVNNDGVVNIGDITTLANYLLGNETGTFIQEAADVLKDGCLNVADIVGISRIILNGTTP